MSANVATRTPVQHPPACPRPAGRIRVRLHSLPPLPRRLNRSARACLSPYLIRNGLSGVITHPSDSPVG